MNLTIFSSEVELSKFLGSTDVIPDAYRAISETFSAYQLHTRPSGIKVLVFDCFPDYTTRFLNREFDLVSSEDYKVVELITTKVNPNLSINKVAVELFMQHYDELSKLLNQVTDSPLVITGQGIGGYLAILFALLHQNEVDVAESKGSKSAKRPICVTFGSPLLGNENLQAAISERPQWESCFLNIVSTTDPLASFFTSNTQYKPFGTFLFCTESGGHTTFEDQSPIMAVLDAMALSTATNNTQIHDYSNELGLIGRAILYRGASEIKECSLDPLRVGIMLQFQEIGLLNDISHDLIAKIENKRVKMIKRKRKANAYEPSKKLNEMKISLTYMEWYMKGQRSKGGYYDSYKKTNTTKEIECQQTVIKHQRVLNQYWKKIVEDNNRMPQRGVMVLNRWLYGGTNYRRIIEPLDIADHYKRGQTNYMEVRPKHYELLEKWLKDDKKDQKPSNKKRKACSLTEDSCFWAHVEEALILLSNLEDGGPKNIATEIERFEMYVWGVIQNFSVSPEVFLDGSSLMKWWSKYKAYKGSSYDSEFVRYMNNESYKSYQ